VGPVITVILSDLHAALSNMLLIIMEVTAGEGGILDEIYPNACMSSNTI
jgi:hypothetical protein